MKIFISWSGETSHKVAIALRDWLPSVIQSLIPYVSSEDIDKGARWSSDIASELDQSAFGLLCVTKENVNAPWLNFEAGALGKSVDKSKVCPFLFNVKRSDVAGPILQFQSTIFEHDDVYKLVKSINDTCGKEGLEDARLEKTFEVWWPKLEQSLRAIEVKDGTDPDKTKKPKVTEEYLSKILEEVLEISRTNQKLLRDPSAVLPAEYFEYVLDRVSSRRPGRFIGEGPLSLGDRISPGAIEELVLRYREFLKLFSKFKATNPATTEVAELLDALKGMDSPLRYIAGNVGMRLPKEPLSERTGL